MGIDIHMFIAKDEKIIRDDIFDGRNSEWFRNIMGDGNDEEYNTYPVRNYHWKNEGIVPEELIKGYPDDIYYGFRIVNVGKFREWFEKVKPYLSAGWVSRYDAWAYEKKGIIPFDSVRNLAVSDLPPEDAVFIEYENPYDCSKWLYDYLAEEDISDDAFIVYCFDC